MGILHPYRCSCVAATLVCSGLGIYSVARLFRGTSAIYSGLSALDTKKPPSVLPDGFCVTLLHGRLGGHALHRGGAGIAFDFDHFAAF